MISGRGQSIEDHSMEIIEQEIGTSHPYDSMQWPIVRRIIHATADFDFAGSNRILFHKGAIESGLHSMKNGKKIVVDVSAVLGGLNKQNLNDFGCEAVCNISSPEVVTQAKKDSSKTRAQISMRVGADDMEQGIVAIGNSPTALLELIDMIKEKAARPALVIGIPVGFVSAAESKEELAKLDYPHITNIGRKGGSPCASSIINALFKIARKQ